MSSFTGSAALGNAKGSISIDVSDLLKLQSLSQQVGQTVAKNLAQINNGAKTAQQGTQSLTTSLGSMGRALGIVGGLAGAVQFGRFALDADAAATAYKRQSVAALSLAGSQSKLNDLLSTYDRVTGGVIDRATAMADVTKLQAIGFADSTKELERFATAARGISVGMGRDQDYVISQLQLEMTSQRGQRLDQIGLGREEVAAKSKELQKADSSLTKEIAYQNAVLDVAIGKFGGLVKSTVAQATGAEKAAKAWKDFKLAFGESFGSDISTAMAGAATQIKGISDLIKEAADNAHEAKKAFDEMGGKGIGGAAGGALNTDFISPVIDYVNQQIYDQFSAEGRLRGQIRGAENMRSGLTAGLESGNLTGPALTRQKSLLEQVNTQLGVFYAKLQLNYAGKTAGANDFAYKFPGAGRPLPEYTDDQLTAIRAWSTGVKQIEREAATSRLEATRQFGQQWASTIHEYEQSIARDAQDFGISRRRQAADLAENIADIQKNSVKQAGKWAEDLAESIAKATGDSNERIAKINKDSNKRIAEIDDDYRRSREKAARTHSDSLMEAAGNLDAKAIYAEQKRYAEESKDAADAHDKSIEKEKDGQAERIAEEQASLAKRIKQDQDANAERLADAAEADKERIQDAKDALVKQQAQEDEDRAIRLQRMAADHQDQLDQMAAAQVERMAQIDAQEAEQRAALDEEFKAELDKLGIHNEAWLKAQDDLQRESLRLFKKWWDDLAKVIKPQVAADDFKTLFPAFAKGGPVMQTGLAHVDAGEYVLPRAAVNAMGGYSGARQIQMQNRGGMSIGDINFSIIAAPGMSPDDIAIAVRGELLSVFSGLN